MNYLNWSQPLALSVQWYKRFSVKFEFVAVTFNFFMFKSKNVKIKPIKYIVQASFNPLNLFFGGKTFK